MKSFVGQFKITNILIDLVETVLSLLLTKITIN
jgi:hypothetical protein